MQTKVDHSGEKTVSNPRRLIRDAAESLDRRPQVPDETAGYQIFGSLGRGGVGIVYRAEQAVPKRMVALKVLASESLTKEKMRRFAYEAEFFGRLQHSGIACIYDSGFAEIQWDLALLILDQQGDMQEVVELLESTVNFQNQFNFNHQYHALARISFAEAL